jgi:hypothetical protein
VDSAEQIDHPDFGVVLALAGYISYAGPLARTYCLVSAQAGRATREGTEQGERLCWCLPEHAVPDVGEDMVFESRVLRR